MTTARQHHYIPQFYLKGFAAAHQKKPKVHVFDSEKRTWLNGPTNIKNIGTVRDFNRIDVAGHPPDAIEKTMSAFESEISRALNRVCASGEMPSDEDFIYVMNLMAMISTRNPFLRKNHDKFIKDVIEQITDLSLATKERYDTTINQMKSAGYGADINDVSYEDMLKFHNEKQYTLEINNGVFIKGEFEAFDTVVKLLWKRDWCYIKSTKETGYFITSDYPVHLRWSDPKLNRGFYPPGHALQGTDVVFPVSKDTALIGTFDGQESVINANRQIVALVNSLIVEGSCRQIYSSQNDFEVLDKDNKVVSFTNLIRASGRYT